MFILTAELPDEHEKQYWTGVRWQRNCRKAKSYSKLIAVGVANAVEHQLLTDYDFPVDVTIEELR